MVFRMKRRSRISISRIVGGAVTGPRTGSSFPQCDCSAKVPRGSKSPKEISLMRNSIWPVRFSASSSRARPRVWKFPLAFTSPRRSRTGPGRRAVKDCTEAPASEALAERSGGESGEIHRACGLAAATLGAELSRPHPNRAARHLKSSLKILQRHTTITQGWGGKSPFGIQAAKDLRGRFASCRERGQARQAFQQGQRPAQAQRIEPQRGLFQPKLLACRSNSKD